MTRQLVTTFATLLGLAGCLSYRGGARSVDPARVTTEAGWVVARAPSLHQRGDHDCGAAALAMIAGHWDLTLDVATAAAALPAPNQLGVRLGDLRDAARTLGLTAYAIAGDRDTLVHELREGRPVIVGLLLPFGGKRAVTHYEVVVAVRPVDGRFVTIDPARGWRVRRWDDLDAEWRPVGRPTLVVLGRAAP